MGFSTQLTSETEDSEDLSWPLPVPDKLDQTSSTKSLRQKRSSLSRKTRITLIAGTIIIFFATGLGLGLGLGLSRKTSSSSESVTAAQGTTTVSSGESNGQSSNAAAICAAKSDTFQNTQPWRGVNIGNWLILERWINPSYYAFYTGINKTDEWSFCESLAENCGTTLEAHWNDWLSEGEIGNLAKAGFNLLRVPIGFWAFMDPYPWEQYYRGSQTTQLTRLLSYAKTYNMSVILDLHGLPGSQNGLEHSGHLGPINFFNSTNQARSLTLMDAVITFIQNSTFQEQIVALEVANEPNIYDKDDLKIYKTYLTSSYAKVQALNELTGRNLTMMYHDGFIGASHFTDTFDSCAPVVVDYHQYFFDSDATASATQNAICAVNVPTSVRVFYGEWSLSFGYGNNSISWLQSAYETQLKKYANTTGSAFWSFKVYNGDGTQQNNAWSAQGLIDAGAIIRNSTWAYQHSFC